MSAQCLLYISSARADIIAKKGVSKDSFIVKEAIVHPSALDNTRHMSCGSRGTSCGQASFT